jgi:hypothetical protein
VQNHTLEAEADRMGARAATALPLHTTSKT